MANILLVDSDEVAQKAMRGIVSRAGHRFAVVGTGAEALKFIRSNIKVDLIYVELRLQGDSGLGFVQQLKVDSLLRLIPIVVYTGYPEKESVRQALEFRVQNVLLKPYREEAVYAEISKARSDPWWQKSFEAGHLDWDPERLEGMLCKLRDGLAAGRSTFEKWKVSPGHPAEKVIAWLKQVSTVAGNAGAHAVSYCLDELCLKASAGEWPSGKDSAAPLGFASGMIDYYLNPDEVPDGFKTEEEQNSEEEARERAYWSNAFLEDRCPVVGRAQLEKELDRLASCPTAESIVAAFKMSANGKSTSLAPLLDLIQNDPGLTSTVLGAANRLKKSGDSDLGSDIEDTRIAVGQLGENRLAIMGGELEAVEERMFEFDRHSSWRSFRMFQLGTARIAAYICDQLDLPDLRSAAYTAGLASDIGSLLLARLHPYAYPAIRDHVKQFGLTEAAAEKQFLTCSTRELAHYFSEKQGLPKRIVNVLKWLENVEDARVDRDLVAVVSLARHLCVLNKVGYCGLSSEEETGGLSHREDWRVLSKRLYLNFDIARFEKLVRLECSVIKRELSGGL